MNSLRDTVLESNPYLKINFDGGDLSSDAGLLLIKEFAEKIGLVKLVYRLFKTNDPALYRFHIDPENLLQMIYQTKAVDALGSKVSEKILVKTKNDTTFVYYDKLDYVESSNRFPHYVMENETVTGLMMRLAFREELASLIADSRFFLCGASFIVNLSRIKSIEKSGILFFDGKRLAIPRTSLKPLRMAWTSWWLKT